MVLNEKYFSGDLYNQHIKYAHKGILKPEPEKLVAGRFYYRIGHANNSNQPTEKELNEAIVSPWWMEFDVFRSIMEFAETNSISGTVAGRVKNAVAPSFGKSNLVVKAYLEVRLKGFIGAGRPIESGGAVFFPPGNIKQIYIPGLFEDFSTKKESDICSQAFPKNKRTFTSVHQGLIVVQGE